MTLLSRTRLVVVLLAAVTLASAGCASSSPSPEPSPSPSPTPAAEATPDPSPEPSADPTPELATEPEDVAAYCDAIQAVHDAPDTPLGTPSSARVEATEHVAAVAPSGEKEFWRNAALLFDNTQDREVIRSVVEQHREVDGRVRERCGFGVP